MALKNFSNFLICTILILLIFLYLQYYLKFNDGYDIIQVNLDKVNDNILYEKKPVIIYDQIFKIQDILKTLFKYTYINSNNRIGAKNITTLCLGKYNIIYSKDETIYINIISPKYKKEFKLQNGLSKTDLNKTRVQYMTIKLRPHQLLLLPPFWLYNTDKTHNLLVLHDILSIVVEFIFRIKN